MKTIIVDRKAINNGHQSIGRNKYYMNKKVTKISSIVDINGIILSLLLFQGNDADVKRAYDTIDRIIYSPKKKRILLADAGYRLNMNQLPQNFVAIDSR